MTASVENGDDRKRWIIASLWTAAAMAAVAPDGVWTQIKRADSAIDRRVGASPIGKLCYSCQSPAVQWADYTDGSRRYFCTRHPPPAEARANTPGDYGGKKFNPTTCLGILGLVLIPNLIRAIVHLATGGRWFKPTIPGAWAGVGVVALAWAWFHSLT